MTPLRISAMNILNPLTGSILQSTQVQRQQSADKDQQMRRLQQKGRNIAARGDQFEHTVESAEELTPMQDQDKPTDQKRRKPPKPRPVAPTIDEDPENRIDLTA
jgi:hypothetical protein